MEKRGKIALLVLAFLVQAAIAAGEANLEITSPESGRYYTFTGSATVTIKVQNSGDMVASGAYVTVDTVENLAFSVSGSQTIDMGDTASFTISISGIVVEKKKEVKATVYYLDGAEPVEGDSISFYLTPGTINADILSPIGEIRLVDFPENGTTTFSVKVKNTGQAPLYGVKVNIDPKYSGISCTWDQSGKDITVSNSADYPATCSNVSNGKEITISISDTYRQISQYRPLTFFLVESVKNYKLDITSPIENSEFRLGEYGGDITLEVSNIGEVKLFGVCAAVSNMQYTSSGCVDIDVGQPASFVLNIVPVEELTIANIVVSDSNNRTKDELGLRVIKVQAVTPPEENGTIVVPVNITPFENITAPPVVEESEFPIPGWVFVLLIILVPAIVLLVFIKISVSRSHEG